MADAVFVLVTTADYEGQTFRGVYSTEDRARAAFDAVLGDFQDADHTHIFRVALDAEPHALSTMPGGDDITDEFYETDR